MIPETDPVHREAMLHLAMLLSRQKKPDEAIEIVRKLREENPGDVELMIFLAGQLRGGEAVRRGVGRGHRGDRKGP